jgi:MOSC domain-containing protein YiiM
MTIDEMNQLLVRDRYNRAMIEKALATAALPESWRDYFSRRLASAGNAEIDAR